MLLDAIHFWGSLMGWEVTYSDKRDLFMKYYFAEGYVFLRAVFSNGVVIRVKTQMEGIQDELVLSMLSQLRVLKSIKSEYRYYEFYEMIQNVHLRGRGDA